jgi:hypothetical protein
MLNALLDERLQSLAVIELPAQFELGILEDDRLQLKLISEHLWA